MIHMKVAIANDHRGTVLKEQLVSYLKKSYQIINYGTDTLDSVDYPDYAFQVGEAVRDNKVTYGIVICGSGIGISIACNKVNGVRCAKVNTVEEANYARLDNDANVIALAATINVEEAKKIVDTFLKTSFSKEMRHQRRIDKIGEYEQQC